jgi:hypothetical protein
MQQGNNNSIQNAQQEFELAQKELEVAKQKLADEQKLSIELQKEERAKLLQEAIVFREKARNAALLGDMEAAENFEKWANESTEQAKGIVIEGEVITDETVNENNPLDDYRSGNKSRLISVYTVGVLILSFVYFYANNVILYYYPDAGVHAFVTLHKVLAVSFLMMIIELLLIGIEKLKDNYLTRYGDSSNFQLLDKVKDFANTNPQTRLWLRFAYFALRFFCAITLASGNLI